ncbi:MAG TPA: T9SS type A sorting domain-containing protein [Ignavibacteria bacterium]|nr:T9SS type A sorting domain-containing protein [Ignavibacteria bacterium]
MKYIYLIILFLFTGLSVTNAQLQFQRVGGSDTTHTNKSNAYAYAWYKNTGASPVDVRFERTVNNLPNASWTSSICTQGFCYAPFVNIAPPAEDPAITIQPGEQDTMDVTMYCPNTGVAHIRLKMFNVNNASQFVEEDFYVVAQIVGIENISSIADKYSLSQNYPNPFNPVTKINFSIPKNEFVTLKVYDVLGNEVANLVNQNLTLGQYTVDFNSAQFNVSSGVFYYKLMTEGFTEVKKMMLVK